MKKEIILHFEDDDTLAGIYGKKFSMAGMDYRHYLNPTQDPVRLALSVKPDVIIMDIIMPVMDGYAATKLLKADERTKDIPIMGLCNLNQKEDVERCYSLGMVEYLISAQNTPGDVVNKARKLLNLPPIEEKGLPPLSKAVWHGPAADLGPVKKPASRLAHWLKDRTLRRLFGKAHE